MSNHLLKNCLCCGSGDLRLVLDLGVQPPANSYTRTATEKVEEYPLGLNVCGQCWHAQLTFCVDRQEIFDRYAYVSGTSGTLNRFFKWFAASLASRLPAGARVLELAANDGSLIKEMQSAGIDCVGVDPARNIVEQAQAQGLPIVCGYWPAAAEQVSGQFDAIVCMNVVAHVDDPKAFIAACRSKLKPGGVLLIQPSQARMFGNHEFDTCYHEHISFFNTRSMGVLAESVGLKLVDTALVKIHGDSPIYMLCHPDAPASASLLGAFRDGDFAIAEDLATYEAQIQLYDWRTYDTFRSHAKAVVDNLGQEVARRREQGFDVVFVGAAAKAMTVVNAGNIRPDRFLDESPLKIGLHAPGIGTRIEGLDACRQLTRPAFFVITAWNFRHELAAKLRAVGVPQGSVFYSYFPKPEVL
ncbi:MAG: methyltransferase domain-containing protein [Roseateles sp.]